MVWADTGAGNIHADNVRHCVAQWHGSTSCGRTRQQLPTPGVAIQLYTAASIAGGVTLRF
jgi:hypothetical protein